MGVQNWFLILGLPETDRVILDNSFFFSGSWVPYLLINSLIVLLYRHVWFHKYFILCPGLQLWPGQVPNSLLSGEENTCRENVLFSKSFFISCQIPLDSFRFLIIFFSRSWKCLMVWVTTDPLMDFFPVRFLQKFLLGPLGRGTLL